MIFGPIGPPPGGEDDRVCNACGAVDTDPACEHTCFVKRERRRLAAILHRAADSAEYGTAWEALRNAADAVESEEYY